MCTHTHAQTRARAHTHLRDIERETSTVCSSPTFGLSSTVTFQVPGTRQKSNVLLQVRFGAGRGLWIASRVLSDGRSFQRARTQIATTALAFRPAGTGRSAMPSPIPARPAEPAKLATQIRPHRVWAPFKARGAVAAVRVPARRSLTWLACTWLSSGWLSRRSQKRGENTNAAGRRR